MADDKIYPIPQKFAENAYINEDKYQSMYQQSIDNPETFWGDMANNFLDFSKTWD